MPKAVEVTCKECHTNKKAYLRIHQSSIHPVNMILMYEHIGSSRGRVIWEGRVHVTDPE